MAAGEREGNREARLSYLTAPHFSPQMIINYICALIQFASFLSRQVVLSHPGVLNYK